MDRFQQEAFEFVTGPTAREAFDLNHEEPRSRDLYGRHTWGQSTLLARRLVEAGSTFVTVTYAGWDHHWDLQAGYENYLPMVDSAVAALFHDLDQRGLLDTTLVVLCGEFGRTPRMNDGRNGGPPVLGTPGRDHWGDSMFCLMGGGGVKGGRIVGSTDDLAASDAAAAQEAEHGVAPVVAAGRAHAPRRAAVAAVVHLGRAAELAAHHDQRRVQQAPLGQVAEEGRRPACRPGR